MNILVLLPNHRNMRWSYFTQNHSHPAFAGDIKDYHIGKDGASTISGILRHIQAKCLKAGCQPIDSVAIRVAFGGSMFKNPKIVTPEVVRQLEKLIPQAPLHLPITLELIQRCGEIFPDVPVVLVFETAFFAHLPVRESLYGIDAVTAKNMSLKRFGYHGIFHEAVCREIKEKTKSARRVISICLESQPEVAAVIGNRPVMITSGATPLEGIPGQTSCGELDPSVVLSLAEKKDWGPEQINTVLTQESGLCGLVGRKTTLKDVFTSNSNDVQLARRIITYRLILACGAAMAAMGGLDVIAFSGRFAELGIILGPYLAARFSAKKTGGKPVEWRCFAKSLDSIIADIGALTILRKGLRSSAKASA